MCHAREGRGRRGRLYPTGEPAIRSCARPVASQRKAIRKPCFGTTIEGATLNENGAIKSIPETIFDKIVLELFNVPIMSNLHRPHYVEQMITLGLGEGFALASSDWAGWDIDHESGVRIEVKQSAARQTWTETGSRKGKATDGVFDIAPRTGYFEQGGAHWVKLEGRPAHLYIFAWHPINDIDVVDHRDPGQWQFFVVKSEELPHRQKTLSRRVVERSWQSVNFSSLRDRVLAEISALSK